MRRLLLASVLGSGVLGLAAAWAAAPQDTGAAAAASESKPDAGGPPAKVIWDLSRIPDREKTRIEFPNLIRFKGAWYCSFREGEIHGNHPSGRGRVIRSVDGEAWESVALMEWDCGDVRDPRLSITAEGMLMLHTSVYFVSRQPRPNGGYYQLKSAGTASDDLEMNVNRQSVTWLSPDGLRWGTANACPTGVNTWRWDVAWHNGMGYGVGYAGKDGKGTLYRTRDGRSWRVLKEEFFPDGKGNEASLAFGPDDTAYCLLRGGRSPAMIGIGKPPYYQEWEWKDPSVAAQAGAAPRPVGEVFGSQLGGPKLLCLSDGRLLGAGRVSGRVTLFWVDPQKDLLTKFVDIDGTSYPGLGEHEGMIWVTYINTNWSKEGWQVRLAKVKLPN